MFNNHDSKDKEYCRNIIYNLVSKYKKNKRVNVFTLPSTNFSLEERLLALNKVKLTCGEHDPQIYALQARNPIKKAFKHNIAHYYGDAFHILENPFRQHDIVWLDLCGALQLSTINKFLSFIQKGNLSNNAYVAITYLRGREYYSKEMEHFYGMSLEEFRKDGFPKLVIDFAQMADRKCKLIHQYSYQSSSPMMMCVFKISH